MIYRELKTSEYDMRLKGDNGLKESELYKELGMLTRNRVEWEESIPNVAALLSHESSKIQAKALWLLGEMGFAYPASVHDYVSLIAPFIDSDIPLLRERAVNALGRIGRGSYPLIEPYWADLFRFANDEDAKVRLSFIWASENIATNTPDIYKSYMSVFEALLHDEDDKVRMEAPEIFRVLGKRRPELVMPYVKKLRHISETDSNRVVRIHCMGAIKAAQIHSRLAVPIEMELDKADYTVEHDSRRMTHDEIFNGIREKLNAK